MLSLETVRKIKQSNVSKDTEKTKERIKEEFSSISKSLKDTIVAQTTQNRNAIYRVTQTGSASARIILAMSEVLNISPYYFTGETDEKGSCTDETVIQFLTELGYKKLLASLPAAPAAKRQKRVKKAAETEIAPIVSQPAIEAPAAVQSRTAVDDVQTAIFRVTINESDQMRDAANSLDLASATQLLEALFIRAKAGGNAERLCDIVKHCLLS